LNRRDTECWFKDEAGRRDTLNVLEVEQWPIVITTACAKAAAEAFGFSTVAEARTWVEQLSNEHGVTTKTLPSRFQGRRSRSGYFRVVQGMFILPLANDRENRAQWIATHLLAYADPNKASAQLPLAQQGWELLRQITFTIHAVERFQQRCGGSRDIAQAKEELLQAIAPTARAQQRPPQWSGTRPADFYLVAGEFDQYCLPCRASGGNKLAFEATTCLHRAADLFALSGHQLRRRCTPGPDMLPLSARDNHLLDNGFAFGGRLGWHKPAWITAESHNGWWITFSHRVAIAVRWQPGNQQTPLLLTHIVDGRSWLTKLLDRFRFGGRQNDAASR
jgi:hypothetical protein